jgi:putative inorganic carbon (hco3(-)) transporter
MRDLLLGAIIFAICMVALRRPWVGVLGWTWISLMNPHALTWVLKSMPVAAAIAGSTLLGLLFTKDRREFFVTRESAVLIIFMLWMCMTLPVSFDVDKSFEMWKRVMKIDFMILIAMVLLYSKKHIITLTWVIIGSVGYYGVKGGTFTILTGGNYLVWGPTGTFIEGNNELALALIVILPLFRFLQLQITNRWAKHTMTAAMLLCAAAAFGSHSRGALLAIAAMAVSLWWYGGRKMGLLLIILGAGIALLLFMPEEWTTRMSTISEYQSDASAMGRINAWWMAWNLAASNFLGGGYEIYNLFTFGLYAPNPTDVHAAHSIYFQILGEHGFIGLFLFILMWWLVWLSASGLRNLGNDNPQTKWASDLGAMCQVSITGYAVGGAFLSLAYFDLPYNILVLVVLAKRWVDRKAWLESEEQNVADALPATAKVTP